MLRTEFMPRDTPVEKTFEAIRSVGDVWSFLQGPFLASLYNEVSYTGEPLPPEQHRLVLGQSRVIGRVSRPVVAAPRPCTQMRTIQRADLIV